MVGAMRLIRIWQAWLFAVIGVYPIPHTIALRNLILLAGMVGYGIQHFRLPSIPRERMVLPPLLLAALGMLAVLTVWMPMQIFLFGMFPTQSFAMWRGDWLVMLGIAAFVFFLARQLTCHCIHAGKMLLTAVVTALAAHMVAMLAYQLYLLPQYGIQVLGLMPFGERDYHTGLCVPLLALVMGEWYARLTQKPSALHVSQRTLYALFLLALIATVTIRARNGVMLALGALIAFGLAVAWARNALTSRRGVATLLGGGLLLGIFIVVAFHSDSRWTAFTESAELAVDIHGHRQWLFGGEVPKTADGSTIDESAYDRTAWATAALEQIAARPWGVGYGHKAFGWAINDAYHVHTGHESSHSGILDFTLANGWLGTLLWLLFVALLVRYALSLRSAAGYMLAAHTLAWLGRIVLDGHFSGFRLEMFALTTGLLLAACLSSPKVADAVSPT